MSVELYDNTRIQDSRKCLRFFYFRHIRDWSTKNLRIPLIYGLSWHEAMDVVWITLNDHPKIKTADLVTMAMEAFHDKWVEEGAHDAGQMLGLAADEIKRMYKFRTPMNAMEMLWSYIEQRRDFICQCELLEVEKPFAVPLNPDDPDLLYVGRLDKVVRTPRKKIAAIEHKTTSLGSKTGVQQNHLDSYNPNSQVDGYLHALRCDYGDKATAAFIDIALVNQYTQDVFELWPVKRSTNLLDNWLWETFYYINQIRQNKDGLMIDREGGDTRKANSVMQAYPKDTSRCFDFFSKCEYHDVCTSWSNPDVHEMPEHFIEKHWSPFDVLGLEKLGLKEEK